jgi:hypothetical protein
MLIIFELSALGSPADGKVDLALIGRVSRVVRNRGGVGVSGGGDESISLRKWSS